MQDCAKCVLLNKKIELLQEELAERKKADKCPDCEKLRSQLEQIQEMFACLKKEKR